MVAGGGVFPVCPPHSSSVLSCGLWSLQHQSSQGHSRGAALYSSQSPFASLRPLELRPLSREGGGGLQPSPAHGWKLSPRRPAIARCSMSQGRSSWPGAWESPFHGSRVPRAAGACVGLGGAEGRHCRAWPYVNQAVPGRSRCLSPCPPSRRMTRTFFSMDYTSRQRGNQRGL